MNSKTIAAALSVLLIVGCGSKTDCGSGSAEKLVVDLINQNNLLGNVYQAAFMMKRLESKQEIDAKSAGELNKLKADQSAINIELQNVVQQCISTGQQSPEMVTATNDIQQLKSQINQAQATPPRLQLPSDAEMFKMPPQQSTNVRRDAEMQYMKDQKDYGIKMRTMNQNLQQMTKAYDDSSEFIKATCSLDKENALRFRAYPSLAEKVNSFASQNVQPVAAKIAKINEGINETNTNARLSKEEKEAKQASKADENIKNAKLKLEDVVTLSKNDKTGASSCRARLSISVKDLIDTKATVYYKLETTSKGDLYGTITDLTD